MASLEHSLMHDGGLVVSSGGYDGGSWFTKACNSVSNTVSEHYVGILVATVVIIGLVLLIFFLVSGYRSGYTQSQAYSSSGASGRFMGTTSQIGLGNSTADQDVWDSRDGFLSSREQPYFPDVTNRVLRMENREKEAVRSLGKINQERLRRSAEDSSSTTPMPWGPFWDEWKKTHPLDGEVEGFSSKDLSPY
jgi:hypothetical protein